jgi:hypothetical protein
LEPWNFENDYAKGKYLYFHPSTGSGDNSVYDTYFKGKKRKWELRLQMKFKDVPPPDAELFFGIELEEYMHMSAATRNVVKAAVAAIKQAVGGVYQTYGDDPSCKGEQERPMCTLPLWAFDQIVVTPQGQDPPALNDINFPDMGSKRYNRIGEYCKELDALRQNLDSESTYTFAFWGNSRFLDVINWQLVGIPLLTPLAFDKLAKKPPVYAVLYQLVEDKENTSKGRHIASRQKYFFKAAIWSSKRRPDKKRFEALTGSTEAVPDVVEVSLAPGKPGLKRRMKNMVGSFTCCTTRPSAEVIDSDGVVAR